MPFVVQSRGTNRSPLDPFLKWAGGKRWLVSKYADLFPTSFESYFEPFLGSGAVFFALDPSYGYLSDVNATLIQCFVTIRDHPIRIEERIAELQQRHSREFYYEYRSAKVDSEIEKASQFLYLNRVCWNGLYRVNKRGAFNVPMGTKTSVLLSCDDFVAVAERLAGFQFEVADFEKMVDLADEGDFIFADPPYTVKHDNNGFVKYNENIFSWGDQIRLKAAVDRASARGVKIMVLNANHPSISDLYKGFGCITKVYRKSVIAGKSSARSTATELVIRNFR